MGTTSAPVPVARLGYLPALDGLRAVSVLAVIVHHARPSLLPGGFLGVDVFFVLSGFLITTLLLEEMDRTGRISLRGFYLRRARRLFPALAALLLTCLAIGLVADGPMVDTTRRGVLPVALYVANWAEAFGADLGGLQHMWSLAIEEQFYLLWPLLLVVLLGLRHGRRRAMLVALFGATVVVLLRSAAVRAGMPAERLYYGLDTRADGVLIGCALALARSMGVVPRVLSSRAVSLAGSAALALLVVAWRPQHIYVGFLVAGLAAAAVVARVLAHPDDRATAWLQTPWLAWVGRLSYGLYLWHWPIFYFLRVQDLPVRLPGAAALTVAVAVLSAHYVERPFLRRRQVAGPPAEPVGAGPTVVAA